MKKRKKAEPIVLNQTELIPTTLGTLNQKENGPFVVIFIILLLLACIVGLPYLDAYLNPTIDDFPGTPTTKPKDPTKPTPDDPGREENYYDLSDTLNITFDGFTFTNFKLDNENYTLQFLITNVSGTTSYFQNRNYFMELYDNENTLLQRIKLTKEEIASSINYTYNVTNPSKIKKILLTEINEQDYPNITLITNNDGVPALTCTKDTRTITYHFTKPENDEKYQLTSFTEQQTFSNQAENYNDTLITYTTLAETLGELKGVDVDLLPISSGFNYRLSVDLNQITNNEWERNFKEDVYYKKDTEAKIIAFDLSSSGFTCNDKK